MRRKLMIFVAYSPAIIVGGQVLVNLLSFIWPSGYAAAGFYLNTVFGTNVIFALVLLTLTVLLKFCAVSFWAAIAECLFAINWIIVQEDNLYNILFQVIIGTVSLIAVFWHYIKKFPLCRMSLFVSFIKSVVRKRSCTKGLEHWDSKIDGILLKKHHEN